ncbi:aminotransferase-like domain-containing protein [Janthinobacterium sp. B9-8]|uniref:aminotransferase-like domain-containing protein n=1 Tax=Janthinobacterium sp. B9-8 TaxID=1236179 RepID=UPI00061D1D36|nr:PLP-dependent aminotransferase family protein [Janthinobacterium sp. B9-8]AMC36930.1 2-aminoadipate aminotransferase [Janthinobacterium sp. B9-8]
MDYLYQRWAAHYLAAIVAGTLKVGERMPSLRELMRLHGISLSTALQLCRQLETDGYLEARPRSGYFVRQRMRITPVTEPRLEIDPAQYVGIHARVSGFIARGRQQQIKHNFSVARCSPDLYPGEALKNAAIRALKQTPDLFVSAVPNKGNPEFRAVLAKRAMRIGVLMSPDEVLITHGCIEALNLALRAVAQPGDTIAVESPTFYGLLQVLESLGLQAIEIPTSPQTGISIEALELACQTYDNIKAVVVVPHLQNPLGSIMPEAHKDRLVALCEAQAIPLIEDDTYSELINDDIPLRALKARDQTGNVIYCASLHKILAPGMRLGWMSGGRWQARIEMLKYAQTRDNEAWSQIAAAEYMGSSAYDRHLRKLRSTLKTQRERTAEAIARYFPVGTRLNVPNGGLALWVELPEQLSSRRVFDAALKKGILIAPGLMFSNSNRFEHFIRINCGWPFSPEIDHALQSLGNLITEIIEINNNNQNDINTELAE